MKKLRLTSIMIIIALFIALFVPYSFAMGLEPGALPFEVLTDKETLTATEVGTSNLPEFDADMCAALGYAPKVYLVSVPYGCDTLWIKALDDDLLMGESSDHQDLTGATPDAEGYYTLTINITEDMISEESQWKDEGFSFFTNPEVPLFDIEEGQIPTENVEGLFF
nr:hypothetical protein [Bacillota bacterium]